MKPAAHFQFSWGKGWGKGKATTTTLTVTLSLCVSCVLLTLTPASARADDGLSGDNPYAGIVARNVFNLVPIPTNNPADEAKAPEPPAKITPDGIMNLFGSLQVLFKVSTPPKAGQPPQDQSYTMSEGDRQDGIEVVKIDETAQAVTFDNHGILQTIPLVPDTGSGGPGVADSGGGGGGGRPGWHGRFPGRGRDGGGFGGRGGGGQGYGASGGDNSSSSVADNSSSSSGQPVTPSYVPNSGTTAQAAQAQLNQMLNDPNYLTPEAQVLIMEKTRQDLQSSGDPSAAIIPPTDLTPGAGGDGGDSGSGN